MKNNALQTAIQAAQNQKGAPVSALVNNLNLAAVVSKMVKDPYADSRRKNTERFGPNQSTLRSIADNTASKITDVRNFLQLLPDLKLAIDILISSVLSPKDMIEPSVTFSSSSDFLPNDVLANLNSVVTDFFSKDYKITPMLQQILWDVLVETGSYAIAVLPENAVDDAINRGRVISKESFNVMAQEDLFGSLGILGPSKYNYKKPSFSFESFNQSTGLSKEEMKIKLDKFDTYITVNDNPNIIKRGLFSKATLAQKTLNKLGFGKAMENYTSIGVDLFKDVRGTEVPFYKDQSIGHQPLVVIKTQDQLKRYSAGAPLIMHINSEAVIPVFPSGERDNHLGYFVILDEVGNPISVARSNDFYAQLKSSFSSNADSNSSMVQRMVNQYEAVDMNSGPNIDVIVNAYTDMIERDLNARLRNGMQGGEVKLCNTSAIMRIMLARTFQQQFTQVLYVPRELMTYIAVDYNEYGIGKSLLEDMKVICSLRVVTMFANTMASVKNSIGRTEVNVKFDEFDADPWNTLETIMGELNRVKSGITGNLPIGASGPAEVVDWLSKAAYEFTFEGHPAMPDVKIDFNETNSNYTKVDPDLDEDLRKRTLQAIGIPPELVDNAFSPDFATAVTNNNIMLSKRVLGIQDAITPHLSEHGRKVMYNDIHVIGKLRDIISAGIDDIIKRLINNEEINNLTKDTPITEELKQHIINTCLTDYIEHFEMTLPRPNSVEITNQIDAFKTYSDALEEGLNQFFDTAFASSDTMGELGDKIDIIKSSVKAMYLRQWMAENAFIPELFDLVTEDENGHINRDVYQDIANHIEKLTKATARFVKSIQPSMDAANTWAESMNVEETENDTGSDNSGDNSDDTDDNDGDFDMGDDDFSFDGDDGNTEDDTGEEDAPADEGGANEE